jgi:hypothetical protein
MDGRRLNGIDPNAADAEVAREVRVLVELGEVGALVGGIDQVLAPQVGGEAGDAEPPAARPSP